MIKIGIIGTDSKVFQAGKLVRNIEGFQVSGCYGDESLMLKEQADLYQFEVFDSCGSLSEKSDAVIINAGTPDYFNIISNCLRNFKHVFVVDANCLRQPDFVYYQKLAEESNVCFYPEFGFKGASVLDVLSEYKADLQFVDIRHSLGGSNKLRFGSSLSSLLINDLTFLYGVTHANVQRVNANGWNFNPAGTGMISARFDFDNAVLANLLVLNSGSCEDFQMVLYTRSVLVKVLCAEEKFIISRESLSGTKMESTGMEVSSAIALKRELQLFLMSVNNDLLMTRLDVKGQALRTSFLIQEKINQLISPDIFSS
ncbi:MAG: hypothetical protein Q8928_08330 [Bacteroidota bacterium]|nr:hypothetical protein [Bacteroidota bacterium]